MNDDRFEDLVKQMKQQHNAPPETPRDRMWERIDAARQERRGVVRPDFKANRRNRSGFWRLAAAAAAILVLGIAVGRMLPESAPGPVHRAETTVPEQTAPVGADEGGAVRKALRDNDPLLHLAAADLFGRADVLLTELRSTSCANNDLTPMPGWADGILLQTRLVLGAMQQGDQSEDAEAGQIEDLLLDLEMVLVQIVGLAGGDCDRDVAWIREGLAKHSTVERLRLMSDNGKNQRPL